MFDFIKNLFKRKKSKMDTLLNFIINHLKKMVDDKIQQATKSNPDREYCDRVGDVVMWDVFPRIKIKDLEKILNIEFPKDIHPDGICFCSPEFLQDNQLVGGKLGTPNHLGDLRDSEIEMWSDGEEILDKINMVEARTRVLISMPFNGECYPPYQNEFENEYFWVPNA